MKEMNSLTHSCMHSLASFAIFAFSGRAIFMIRATGAKLRMLASLVLAFAAVVFGGDCGGDGDGDGDECGPSDDISQAARRPFSRHASALSGWRQMVWRVIRRSSAVVEDG